MAHSQNGWMNYVSTGAPWGEAIVFSLKADQQTATNNGIALFNHPPVYNFWPLHSSDLRAGYGKDSANHTDHCVAAGTGTPVFTLGSTFQDNKGNSYTVNSLRQERFRIRNLK